MRLVLLGAVGIWRGLGGSGQGLQASTSAVQRLNRG